MSLSIDNQFIMSPKDLCTIRFLDQIIDAGARVLKIEGRARSAEYVRTVTECYGEAAAAVADGTFGPEKVEEWMKRWNPSSTGDSGTATTWGNGWVSGAPPTARQPQRKKSTSARSQTTSAGRAWLR